MANNDDSKKENDEEKKGNRHPAHVAYIADSSIRELSRNDRPNVCSRIRKSAALIAYPFITFSVGSEKG